MFDQTISRQQHTELKQQFAAVAGPGDRQSIEAIYQKMSIALASDLGFEDSPTVNVTDGSSRFLTAADTLLLNPVDFSTSGHGPASWMVLLHATAWHEFGHGFFPNARAGLDDAHELAFNLLEDLRVDARMCAEHPEARAWLRANIIERLGQRPDLSLRADAQQYGWSQTLSIVAGRNASGVLTDDEAGAVRALAEEDGFACYAVLEDLWREYVELSDDDRHQQRRDGLIAALVSML